MNAIERADQAIDDATQLDDEKMLERTKAWKLRVTGYNIQDIAEELGISVGTAHADVRWCLDNLPAAYESAEDFRRVALPRLDEQYRRLTAGRTITIEGEPVYEPPTETAMRVAQSALDLQAKLLGAYAPSRIDGSVTVKTVLAGVDVDEL